MKAKLGGVWLIAAALASPAVPSAVAEDRTPTAISDIRQENTDRSTRVIIECTGPLAYTYYSPDPLTLVVDIPEVDASKVPARINVATREVESLRVTNLARADGRNIARLEVRLASLVPYQIYSKGKALNLVFDRPAAAAAAAPVVLAPTPAIAPDPTPAARTSPPAAEPASAPMEAHSSPPAPIPQAPRSMPAPEAKSSAAKATRIFSVQPEDQDGQLTVTVKADGRLRYQDFFLGNPDRLVVDFPDVVTRASVRPIEVNQGPLRKVRIGQFSAASPKVARLVLDLSARAPYRIVEGSDGLKVVFGEGREPAPAPLAALRAPEPDTPAAALETSAPVAAAQVYSPHGGPGAALAMPVLPEPQLASTKTEDTGTLGGAGSKFTGTPITLDFKDGDLQDIFRLFADISGLNVVVNPGVSGKVTLKLTEVPWDQALDLILKTNGLGYTLEDNVIRIAKLTDLQKEEQDRRKLEEEKALAGALADYTKRISYAKAGTISEVIKKAGALSARGQINVDERTNTMIMRDLPSYIEKAKGLVAELDRATPQVEIEARIVITSRNFTRDLGIQWGFNQEQSPRFANTTNRNFPNAIVLNGGGLSAGGLPANQGGQASDAGIGPQATRGYAVNLPASAANSGVGISMGNILGNFNLDLALTALERQGRGRLLSTPKVTTQNNTAAEIKQGVQIPIQTVANNTVTVQFKDAVLTLKVTPQITDAGTVILSLEVENNSADFANLVNGIPPINTQSAKTIVLVRDGSTAVVGGIYQSNEQTSQSSTPFLGKIPILGYLFRNRFTTSTNNELLLFITPRIVKQG